MFFINNLQCYNGLLFNASGSSCCFFVGSYFWSEVSVYHTLHRLIGLEGLGPVDLNALLADTLGTLSLECKPLLELVLQKMKGS